MKPPATRDRATANGRVKLDKAGRGAALTFEFAEQIVGWPYFTIEAPAGTIVELMVQEGHEVGGPALLNTHFDAWTRFICREGREPIRDLRLRELSLAATAHPRRRGHGEGPRRRACAGASSPGRTLRCSAAPSRPCNACSTPRSTPSTTAPRKRWSTAWAASASNTAATAATSCTPSTCAFGETRLPARYLATFSQGMTKDGYFLDCWPAYDRLARLMERQLDLTGWGPILDHGVGFNFDCWYHYLYTGDLEALREPYPRLLRFAQYLQSIVGQGRPAAGREPRHPVGLDRPRGLPAPAPQAVRLQPLRRRDARTRPGAHLHRLR